MSRSLTVRAVIAAAATAALVAGAVAAPASAAPPVDPSTPATFEKVMVDPSYQGAAFTVVADLYDTGKQNIITSSFGASFPSEGSLQVYTQGATLNDWTKTQVFDESASIIVPNEPKIVDVSGDGMLDIIQPAGFFFDTVPWNPQNRGSITWWENNGPGNPWTRHDVIVNEPWSYHGVQYVDLDGDGVKDIVTSGEQAKDATTYTDDIVETRYFKGAIDDITGERTFGAPIKLADNGGSIPVVEDVDGDGALDILTAQYFGVDEPSYLWLERVGDTVGDELSESNFVMHEIATDLGRGFQIKRVPDFRGDGVDRWIATNHDTFGTPGPDGGVFELTPGEDITEPWTSVTLNDFPIKPRASTGQGAPGGVNAGDVDGDGDLDLVVSGDGDPRLFWIEQKAGGSFETHILVDWDPVAGQLVTGFGQAGGAIASDLDADGRNELVFSSWDRKQVAIWVRDANLNGSFTRTPASIWKNQTVKVTPSGLTADVDTVSINWGDGTTTANASKTAATTHTYTKAGTATIKATLRNAATGQTVVKSVGTVRVNVDTVAPVVTIKKLKAKAKKVKKVNGTIADGGLGPKSVTVSLIQKRGKKWVAYNGKKWVKAKNKKQAVKKSKKITVSATNGSWSTKVKKVKKGKITVTYVGTDVVGNTSGAKKYSKKLK